MPLIKDLTTSQFLKFDTNAYRSLSKNGRLVYLAFLDSHPNGKVDDEYMAKKAKVSLGTYKKGKKELMEKGYLSKQRMGGKNGIINYYFGKNAVRKFYEDHPYQK